jgi:hypothetical protein
MGGGTLWGAVDSAGIYTLTSSNSSTTYLGEKDMSKIIHKELLLNTLDMRDLLLRQIELQATMLRVSKARLGVVEEFARANFTGDMRGVKQLAPHITSGKCSDRYYVYAGTPALTRQCMNTLKVWRATQ